MTNENTWRELQRLGVFSAITWGSKEVRQRYITSEPEPAQDGGPAITKQSLYAQRITVQVTKPCTLWGARLLSVTTESQS